MSEISSSYEKLKHAKDLSQSEVNGYTASKGYPKGFQTVDFPELAGRDGSVTTLAHYQAFFFVGRKDPAKPNDGENQTLNTGKLKELFSKIYDYNTHFTMKMDANALRMDSDAFAKKLGDAGDDAPQVKAQVDIIKEFLKKDGIRDVAKDVIREKNPSANDAEIALKTDGFLKENFKLEGVIIATPLDSAVWQVEAKKPDGTSNGYLEGRQNYYTDKKWDGSWQVGSEPELKTLDESGHKGAKEIRDAVDKMNKMKTIDLTHGLNKKDEQASNVQPPDGLHADLINIGSSMLRAGLGAVPSDTSPQFAGTGKPRTTFTIT